MRDAGASVSNERRPKVSKGWAFALLVGLSFLAYVGLYIRVSLYGP